MQSHHKGQAIDHPKADGHSDKGGADGESRGSPSKAEPPSDQKIIGDTDQQRGLRHVIEVVGGFSVVFELFHRAGLLQGEDGRRSVDHPKAKWKADDGKAEEPGKS